MHNSDSQPAACYDHRLARKLADQALVFHDLYGSWPGVVRTVCIFMDCRVSRGGHVGVQPGRRLGRR